MVFMYITKLVRMSNNGKTYKNVLLRESYREGGKVKNWTIVHLTHCKPEKIATLEFVLRRMGDLPALTAGASSLEFQEGRSVGAVGTVYHVAKRLGLEKALGTGWQIPPPRSYWL